MVDFTQPYIESGLVVVAPVRKSSSNAWAFLRPFTPTMWAVTGSFFLLVGAVVWMLEHRRNDDFRGPPRKQIATILWLVSAAYPFCNLYEYIIYLLTFLFALFSAGLAFQLCFLLIVSDIYIYIYIVYLLDISMVKNMGKENAEI